MPTSGGFSLPRPVRACGARHGRAFKSKRITKVLGIEARGFLLGAAVAFEHDAGFAAVRKGAGILPGVKLTQRTSNPDYRGFTHEFRLQAAALRRLDRVLLVDDWIEKGSQAAAAKAPRSSPGDLRGDVGDCQSIAG